MIKGDAMAHCFEKALALPYCRMSEFFGGYRFAFGIDGNWAIDVHHALLEEPKIKVVAGSSQPYLREIVSLSTNIEKLHLSFFSDGGIKYYISSTSFWLYSVQNQNFYYRLPNMRTQDSMSLDSEYAKFFIAVIDGIRTYHEKWLVVK